MGGSKRNCLTLKKFNAMGNIVLGVNTKFAYYFKENTRQEVDNLIQVHGSVSNAAKAVNPQVTVHLVVETISNADHIQPPQPNNSYLSGYPLYEFDFDGFISSFKTKKYMFPVDLGKIQTAFLSTTVVFRDNQVPVSDVNSNNILAVPDDADVISLANDE